MVVTPFVDPFVFAPWGNLIGTVPQVPEPYWNAVSNEQVVKWLCVNFGNLTEWCNQLDETVSEKVTDLEGRVTAAEDTVNDMKDDVDSLKSRVTANEANIVDLQTRVTTLEQNVTDLQKYKPIFSIDTITVSANSTLFTEVTKPADLPDDYTICMATVMHATNNVICVNASGNSINGVTHPYVTLINNSMTDATVLLRILWMNQNVL